MELIKINTKSDGSQAVSANELYLFLGYDASNWVKWYKKNITANEFAIVNEDFSELVLSTRTKDFALSIDFAKKLAMMSRTDKGEQARKYFIECERLSKQAPIKLTREELFHQAYLESQTMVEELKSAVDQANSTIMIQAPKVEYFDKVLDSRGTYNINLIAKELGTSAVSLNRQLKDLGVQYCQNKTWVLTAKYQDKGYTKTKTFTYPDAHGVINTSMHTVFTEKGRKFIHDTLFKQGSDSGLSFKKPV